MSMTELDKGATERAAVQPPPARRSRRGLTLGLLAIGLIGGGIGGIEWWRSTGGFEETDDAFIDAHVVRISPQIVGRVKQVPVTDNQLVAAGDPLVVIDDADLQTKLAQATASQAAAAGSLAQAKAQQAAADANIAQMRAEVGVAEANASNADTQLKRDQPLASSQVISRQQLDNDVAAAKSSNATLEAARKKEIAAEAQASAVTSQIATAEANVKAAEAMLQQARLDLSYTRITAPEAGRVTHLNVSAGDYLQVGQNVIALVPQNLWITANFKETQLQHMRPGQKVAITVDAYPDVKFQGHVDSIQAGGGGAFSLLPPENATGNYVKIVQRVPVKIVFDTPVDPKYGLGPGMSVVPSVTVQ